MDKIFIDSVRCYYSYQEIQLRPITILIGENNTGKSTLLAAIRIAWDILNGKREIDFNEEPFLLGSFDQIATFRGGNIGRSKLFKIGSTVKIDPKSIESRYTLPREVSITGTFTRAGAIAKLSEWNLDAGPFIIKMLTPHETDKPVITVHTPSGTCNIDTSKTFYPSLAIPQFLSILRFTLTRFPDADEAITGTVPSESDLNILHQLGFEIYSGIGKRPYTFAPIRTRPRRTYDPLQEIPTPEGSHIPIILANIKDADPRLWQSLQEILSMYGEGSGLFKSIDVKRKGRKLSDPFQLRVKVFGPDVNLVDVGYGISQVLPILVEVFRQPEESTLLLQQPEVHLHPKAQAELATFLCDFAKRHNKKIVIETHSDHIVDRIRMEIGNIPNFSKDDLSIYYCEMKSGGVKPYMLKIDDNGNLINVPPGYRDFFLEEEKRLLGV